MKTGQPQNLKGYGLATHIGEGGFGAVYIATQTSIGREVAIKIIKPAVANKPDFIRRFETEAQLIARLEHPHITPLHDYWRDTTGAYLVMRYLKGGSLRDMLDDNGALELNTISILLDQLASALDFAHRQQVIHRDIKPDNILLDEEGNAYLADFGIAKDLAINNPNTTPDAVVGSLDYISPEQARSEPVTARTDIYSLGVVLYELITGDHPFKEVSSIERLYKHINDPLPEVETLGDVSDMVLENINIIIETATQKDPAHRYPDVLSLALAFRDAVGIGDTQDDLSIAEQLTMREHEVLQLIAEGLSNQEIADSLFITISGVKFHLRNTYKKLGVNNRVQAIVRSRELDLITTERIAEHISADGQTLQPNTLSLPEPENPYKGLLAFQYADTRDFFGRDDLSDKLVQLLVENEPYKRFLAVIGPSGSGKSSLTRAGIMPRLKRGELINSKNWFVADMIPGARPLDALEIALIGQASNQPVNLHEQLSRDKFGLVRAAELIMPKDDSQLVIVIDQFEEVFTQVADEAARQHFLDLLYASVTDKQSRVYIIVTLRADYYDRPLHYPEFGEMLRSRMDTILPLTAKGLERAISGPAERVGVTFEAGLVAQIVSEMNYQAGALPLLQYALKELFDRRDSRMLTHSAYQEIGGAVGALANRADEIFLSFSDKAQSLAQQLFLRLVTLGEGAEDTRRRTPFVELLSLTDKPDLMEEIIDTFANYRLLSLDTDEQTRQPTVEVAHEAILREWDRLRLWLNESRDDIRQERTVASAADDWENNQRDNSYLLRGSRLEQTEQWASITRLTLTPLEHDFIQKSVIKREVDTQAESERLKREEDQEKRSQNLLRALVAVFALATILSGGFGFYALGQRNTALDAQAETLFALDVAQRSGLAFAANAALEIDDTDLAVALAIESAQGDEQLLPETLRALERIANNPGPRTWIDTGEVNCNGYTNHDGRYLIITDCQDTAQIWDMFTGELIQTFVNDYDPQNGFGNAPRFSRDNQYILAIDGFGDDNKHEFTFWNVETAQRISHFEAQGRVFELGFLGSQNIVYILTVNIQSLVERGEFISEKLLLVDPFTGDTLREYTFEGIHYNQVNFSADGSLGILGGWVDPEIMEQYQVHIFDVESGNIIESFSRERIGEIDHPSIGAAPIGISPDNTRIWFGGFPNYVINRETGETLFTIEGDRIVQVRDDFEYGLVALGGLVLTDGVSLIDFNDGTVISELPNFGRYYFVSNHDFLITAQHGTPQYHQLWDLNGRQTNSNLILDSNLWSNSAFDTVSGNLAVVNMDYGLQVWNPDGTELIFEDLGEDLTEGFSGTSIAWSPDGRYLATGTLQDGLYLYDTSTWEIYLHLNDIEEAWIGPAKFTNDNQYIIATNYSWNTGLSYQSLPFLLIWDLESGEIVKRIEFPDEDDNWGVMDLEIHPTDNLAYVSISDTYLTQQGFIVDLTNGSIIQEVVLDEMPGDAIFSNDGNYLVIAGLGGTVFILSTDTYQIERQWQTLDSDILGIDTSPDDRYLVTGSGPTTSEATISLWNFETGQFYRRYFGDETQRFIVDVDFSIDGTHIVATSGDKTTMWDVDTQTDLEWIMENRAIRDLTCAERRIYRIEPLCE